MAVAVGFRRRVQMGPALRVSPVPFAGLTLSTLGHAALIVAAVLAVNALHDAPQRVYVINLVPAIPAIGQLDGRGSTPAPTTTRPELPPPSPPRPATKELPRRDTTPAPPREMPAREMPARTRDAVGLPDRTLPPRSAAPAPRPDQKELPSVARAVTPAPPTPAPPAAATPARETSTTPSPPPPAGIAAGSVHGKGKLSIEVDFPYAWYVKIIRDKIAERWDPVALKGQQPRLTFEIGRNGQVPVARILVKQSSGNRAYDQLAVRAVAEASPFPPLPDDFKNALVTIDIQFRFEAERG